jgi:phenylpyruvate tautomerase PptA (4-oxalocrotonate tautomerase family)
MSFCTPAANLSEAAVVSDCRRNRGSASWNNSSSATPGLRLTGRTSTLRQGWWPQPSDCKANDRTKERQMPMIDVYSQPGTFPDKHRLAQGLAQAVMRWEQVPDIPLFSSNTAAFVHDLPEGSISDAAGEGNHVRVQVLTPAGVLDREKQLGVVKELTEIVARESGEPALQDRTWVLITESPEGGWGIAGHANTQADIVAQARAAVTGGS